ncbi:MAG: cyanophycin synthetase [Candidatus Saccharibacteria bacterium]|nr:cyanophycin synthetase [Candidatus Saccharibacteria bacterium]
MSKLTRLKKRLYFTVAKYFRFFANLSLRRWRPRIIAVTGSAGKTTMLNILESKIGERAHYSHNANSAFGVSFDILGLKGVSGSKARWFWLLLVAPIRGLTHNHKEKLYVVEIDGERPHEAEFLATWLKPEVTIWVSIGLSHAAQFEKVVADGTFKNLGEAITTEFANLPANTTKRVYIDADSRAMREATNGIKAKVIAVRKADLKKYVVYPDSTDFTYGDTTFHFDHPEPKDIAFDLLVLSDLMKYLKLSFNPDFSNIRVAPGRSSYFEGKKGIKIIDSSYNAHMISMESILDMVRRMHAEHKWLVIGDIIDQGSTESEEHRKLADLIAMVKPEKVVLVGKRTKKYTAPELKKLGVSAVATTDPKKALSYIEKHITGNETILFKGSQYLEWIIGKLLKNPEDTSKLCRREKAAIRRRKSWGLDG